MSTSNIDFAREDLQSRLDAEKSQHARNVLGQFATPPALARDILSVATSLLSNDEPIRFLDPAVGTGAFYVALREVAHERNIEAAKGFEIDPHYANPAIDLWRNTTLSIEIADFTTVSPPSRGFNLVVANPPYVRHHHLASKEKLRLQRASYESAGIELSGLSGLYCYFLALSHRWMAADGLAAWLIPSEFMDVNYGRAIKRYLLSRVTLLRVHRFDTQDVQFDDALVSSALLFFKNRKPECNHSVEFSWGGTITHPAITRAYQVDDLERQPKWTRFPRQVAIRRRATASLSDVFTVKRGIATGGNSFFILDKSRIAELGLPSQFCRPILPSPRYVGVDEILADGDGNPILDQNLFLLDCRLPEDAIREQYPALWTYLESGRKTIGERYLCRARPKWYVQEERLPAPLLCTYMGRSDSKSGKPFRFLLNHSRAVAANAYLMLYPREDVARNLQDERMLRRVWMMLNALNPSDLMDEGRVYGGGLYKMEPRELANVPIPEIAEIVGVTRPLSLL